MIIKKKNNQKKKHRENLHSFALVVRFSKILSNMIMNITRDF